MATVPVFAPTGELGDIPAEKLHDALKAGYKQGVTMKSPDGKLGVIPADRMTDAAKGGLVPVPLAEQETQHPGFWASMKSDLSAMIPHSASDAAKQVGKQLLRVSTMGASDVPGIVQSAMQRHKEGHGLTYIAGAGLAEGVGANVKGMEQSAEEGDPAGVLGHAATVPAIMAATYGAAKVAPVVGEAAWKVATRAAKVTPKQVAQVVGGASGAGLGHGELSIPGAYYGVKGGGQLAEGILGNERANAPIFKKALPAPSEAEGLPEVEAGRPEAEQRLRDVLAQPEPEAAPPPARIKPAQVEQQLSESMGGKPLERNVPLREQMPNAPKRPTPTPVPPKQGLPEGFTAADSSALKGYKYNAGAKELEAISTGGQHYIYGDVEPEQFAEFDAADSKGQGWNKIRQSGSPLVAKVINGKRVAIKPTGPRSVEVNPATGSPEFSDVLARNPNADMRTAPNLQFDMQASAQAAREAKAGTLPKGMSLVQRAQQIKEDLIANRP